jgi:hypothetical protein
MKWSLIICILLSVAVLGGCESLKSGSPTVPVKIGVRSSVVGAGRVLQITNTSQRTILHLAVRIESPNGRSAARLIDKLDPGETAELGWVEWNWSADPGEIVTVSADGFVSTVVRLP